MANRKYYVVWVGASPGIYRSWEECLLQVKGFKGARFRSFGSLEEAEEAYRRTPYDYATSRHHADTSRGSTIGNPDNPVPPFDENGIAVDAACSGNPGPMEYRGVHIGSGQQLFHFGPIYGTNNIGEFLAIVHGLSLMKKHGVDLPIYSDSANAIIWVRKKKCKTRLPETERTRALFDIIRRAEEWLRNNTYTLDLRKWRTDLWGEIPADFGRKK